MSIDEKWMQRALALAEKGRGHVNPNPMVGAVLVRAGRVVGEGYHRKYGQAHAEVEAIRRAGRRAAGSTLYVTLEPCSHWGKTPPCVEAISRAGIKRIVAAMKDPNPLVSGKGFAALKRGRLAVTSGLLEEDARRLNRAFVTWATKKRPFVTVKAASSLDGRTATVTGESKWITGKKARAAGYRLRAQVDAVAVGSTTVRADNPSLTAHGFGRNPVRIVFDSHLKLPLSSRIFNRAAQSWEVSTDQAVVRRLDEFKRKGVQVVLGRPGRDGRVDVRDALRRLAERGITHLLVEGGEHLQQSFFQAGVVDEVVWFIAPLVIGRAKRLRDAWALGPLDVEKVGPDLQVRACLPESFKRSAK